eukprot:UN14406
MAIGFQLERNGYYVLPTIIYDKDILKKQAEEEFNAIVNCAKFRWWKLNQELP